MDTEMCNFTEHTEHTDIFTQVLQLNFTINDKKLQVTDWFKQRILKQDWQYLLL